MSPTKPLFLAKSLCEQFVHPGYRKISGSLPKMLRLTSILAFRPLKQDWIIVAALSTLKRYDEDAVDNYIMQIL